MWSFVVNYISALNMLATINDNLQSLLYGFVIKVRNVELSDELLEFA